MENDEYENLVIDIKTAMIDLISGNKSFFEV